MNIVTLSNGKKVGNFSSAHTFKFSDGNVLPAHTKEFSDRYCTRKNVFNLNDKGDVSVYFEITTIIGQRMDFCRVLWENNEVDVIMCPLPMILALQKMEYNLLDSPFRTVFKEERNTFIISIDKQCI